MENETFLLRVRGYNYFESMKEEGERMKNIKIGIIEDEKLQRELLKDILILSGFNVKTFSTSEELFNSLESDFFDVLIVDYRLKETNGIEILKVVKKNHPFIQIILVTAYGDVELAVQAMKAGAFDFLQKPIKKDELIVRIKKAIEFMEIKRELKELREKVGEGSFNVDNFVYKSPLMENIVKMAVKVAKSNANVLIIGETGTGKEKIAEIIHYSSDRTNQPFIKVNISAIPETLIESELFGAERGAYTGADRRIKGKFEAANGGTLFLDEIAEIPLVTQAKLLRVIQDKKVTRLGSSTPIETDVRIIAATNKNLEKLVKEKKFRDDFYYRLNVIKIEVPPLRERKEEIPYLIDYFIKKFNERENKNIKGVSRDVIKLLNRYNFPGNIRELENIIERGVVLNDTGVIEKKDIASFLAVNESDDFGSLDALDESLPLVVERIEKKLILKALEKSGGVKTKAARLLGISERVLRYKINQLGINYLFK